MDNTITRERENGTGQAREASKEEKDKMKEQVENRY